jgi:monovalent cation:H+ antiporter-2, CPA2 family
VTTIALAIVAAALALGLARWRRLPAAALAILAGVGLNASSAPLDQELVRSGLLLAATFLVFAVGAEIDRNEIARYRRAAIVVTAMYLAVTAAIAFSMWTVLKLDALTVTYLVLALGSSSTLVAVELLRRREQFFEPVGRFVTGVAIAQDRAVILALSLVVAVAGGAAQTARALAAMVALVIGAWIAVRWVAPRALIGSRLSEEERLLFVLGLLFAFAGVCWWAGLPIVLGAYLTGVVLSPFPIGATIRSQVASFSDFFTVLFFVFLGVVIEVPQPTQLLAEIVLIATVLLLRPLLLLPIARRVGMTVRSSSEAIALLAYSGELGLAVVLVGIDHGHVGTDLLSIVAVVVVVTMSLEPFLSSERAVWWLTRRYPGRRRTPAAPSLRDHVVLIGCGEGGGVLLDHLESKGSPVVVVDDDPSVIDALDRRGVPAVRGDGGDSAVLRAAGADAALAIVSTMRRMRDNTRLLARFRSVPVLVRVFSETDADQVRRLGGLPVVEASLATGAILQWYEQTVRDSPGQGAAQSG